MLVRMEKQALSGVGRRLKVARVGCGLTQEEAAEALLAQRQTVSAWERGEYAPTAAQLHAICQCYGVSADFLLFGLETIPVGGQAGQMLERIFRDRRLAEVDQPPRL